MEIAPREGASMAKCRYRLAFAAALWLAPLGAAAALAQQAAATGVFHGVGVVTAVDPQTGALTLDHDEIKGFMGAMEMMYRVDPGTLSAGIHVGDRIGFDVDAGRETIVSVKRLEPAK
jgi:Cu/Ag efflux protein CusF